MIIDIGCTVQLAYLDDSCFVTLRFVAMEFVGRCVSDGNCGYSMIRLTGLTIGGQNIFLSLLA